MPGGDFPPYKKLLGGNRDTDYLRVKAASLERITYPTGGYTVFELEANQAKDQWLDQNLPVTIQLPPYTDKFESVAVDGSQQYTSLPFLFQGESNTTTWFTADLQYDGRASAAMKFDLYNKSNQMIFTRTINFTSNYGAIQAQFSVNNLVKNGNYHFRISLINHTDYHDYAQITRREINPGTSYDTVLRHVQPYIGGLRVKKLSDYDGISSTPVKVREYDYLLKDGVTPSGTLGIRPVYSYLVAYEARSVPNMALQDSYFISPSNTNYLIRTTGAIHNAVFVNGSPEVYRRVTERTIGLEGNLGKSVRTFTSFAESQPYISETFPFIEPQVASYYYGKLLKEEIYDSNNVLIRKLENTYGLNSNTYATNTQRVERFRSVIFAPVKFAWYGASSNPSIDPSGQPHWFVMKDISPMNGRAYLTKSVDAELVSGGTSAVTTTNYIYDSNYYQLKETTTTDSRGRVYKSQFKYPHDFTANHVDAGTYQEMLGKNIISPIIEEKISIGSTQLIKKTTRYLKWHNNFFAPDSVKTQKREMAEEDRIVYLQYDQYGAPLSAQQVLGPKVNYIWSYGGTRLIAQVSNLEYSQIQTLLGGPAAIDVFRNKKSPTDAEIAAFIQPLRTGMPAEAQLISFTHHTLQGMTTQTDPAGRRISYEYDEHNRLKAVWDQDGKLIEEYQYHYRNQ